MRIFIGLDHRGHDAKQNGAPQAFLQPVAIPMNQRMMRPCYRRSRAEQDERIEKGELEGVHHFQTLGWELAADRSEEHTSELQSLMRISYAVFCLKIPKIGTA